MSKSTTIIQLQPIELNDGHGSYICEYGHVHNYSKLDLNADEQDDDFEGPFFTFDEYKASLLEGDDDDVQTDLRLNKAKTLDIIQGFRIFAVY